MILSQLQKDVEQIQACLAKGNIDEAETMLELVLMDIKNAQQNVHRTANAEANIGDPRNIERNLSGKRGATRRR